MEEVLKAFKEDKIPLKEVKKYLADFAQGGPVDPMEDALERIREEEAAERSRSREEQEA